MIKDFLHTQYYLFLTRNSIWCSLVANVNLFKKGVRMERRKITEKEKKGGFWWKAIVLIVFLMWAIYQFFRPVWDRLMEIVTGG